MTQKTNTADVLTIRQTVARAKVEGLPITEYSLRHWVKTGAVPVRRIGNRSLLFYPNVLDFVRCANSSDNTTA